VFHPVKYSLPKFLSRGSARSIKTKKNILASFLIKGVSISISLILVPLTINYVNSSNYGIWLTLSSIIGWFSFFDIGLTHGLRNKFAEAKLKGDDDIAQIYVSTTYAILTIIFTSLWSIFLVLNYFINWNSLLNISDSQNTDLSILALIIFTYFCLQFIFKIISTLLIANQQPAKSSLIDLLGQILSLISIFILIKTSDASLIKLGTALCFAPLLILIAANIFFFKKDFYKYRPRISKINFSYAKKLLNLGAIFFIIQISSIIQYQTANIIIVRNFGSIEVTSYNIVYKYFGILNMIFMIFLAPFWSASTEAYLKNDITWIKNSIRKYNQLNILIFLIGCIMVIFSKSVFNIWLGSGKVNINFTLVIWGFIFFNVGIFGSKYVFFLNGINALRIQFWSSLISPFLYVFLLYILIYKFKFGVPSVFIAGVISNVYAYFLAPIQYFKIITKNKKGIWIK